MQDFTNTRESTVVRRPKELVISVELPGVESAATVQLDILEKGILLESETPMYKLDVSNCVVERSLDSSLKRPSMIRTTDSEVRFH